MYTRSKRTKPFKDVNIRNFNVACGKVEFCLAVYYQNGNQESENLCARYDNLRKKHRKIHFYKVEWESVKFEYNLQDDNPPKTVFIYKNGKEVFKETYPSADQVDTFLTKITSGQKMQQETTSDVPSAPVPHLRLFYPSGLPQLQNIPLVQPRIFFSPHVLQQTVISQMLQSGSYTRGTSITNRSSTPVTHTISAPSSSESRSHQRSRKRKGSNHRRVHSQSPKRISHTDVTERNILTSCTEIQNIPLIPISNYKSQKFRKEEKTPSQDQARQHRSQYLMMPTRCPPRSYTPPITSGSFPISTSHQGPLMSAGVMQIRSLSGYRPGFQQKPPNRK